MMVQGPKRCGICSGVKSSRGLFLHLELDAPVLCAAFGTNRCQPGHEPYSDQTVGTRNGPMVIRHLAEEQDIFILAASETGISFRIRPPRYRWNRPRSCPCKDQRSRGDGWFEAIVRKSMSRDNESSKCFGFGNRYDSKAKAPFVRATIDEFNPESQSSGRWSEAR
jgi:hypothetical protein